MIRNTKMMEFHANRDDVYGCLVPVEAQNDVPFDIQRIYYILEVPEKTRRGFHSHIDLEQALVCVHGEVTIHVRTPFERQEVLLDDPAKALYIGPMVWREMYNFSPGAVLLVLASKHYDVQDYIRDYEKYEELAKEYFQGTI